MKHSYVIPENFRPPCWPANKFQYNILEKWDKKNCKPALRVLIDFTQRSLRTLRIILTMRRNEKEITDPKRIEEIIRKSSVCRLGLCRDNRAYIIPVNFGYRDRILYFHSAHEGTKIDILKKNPNVCFEFDIDMGIVRLEESGCNWSNRYQSVIGFGKAVIIEGIEQKRDALDILMANYSDKKFDYPFSSIENTLVYKVEIESMTGKQAI